MTPIKLRIDWTYMIEDIQKGEYNEIEFEDEWVEPIPEDEVDDWYETDEYEREDNMRFWLEGYCGVIVKKVKEIRPVDDTTTAIIADIIMVVSSEREDYSLEKARATMEIEDLYIENFGDIILDELEYFIMDSIWEKVAHVSIQKIEVV